MKCFILGLSMVGVFSLSPAAVAGGRTATSVVRSDPRTGKLVRTVLASGRTSARQNSPAEPQELRQMIDEIAAKQDVEPDLVRSVIQTESNYNPKAVSNKGAQGLMQLIPATAERFGVRDSFDSRDNIEGGVKYLRYLLDMFHGDYERAVAAYNAGEGAVTRYGGVPPYAETQSYVATVAKRLETHRKTTIAQPKSTLQDDSSGETYNPVIASVTPDGRVYYRTP